MFDAIGYEDTALQDVLMCTSIPEIKAYKWHPAFWTAIADIASDLSGDKGLGSRARRLFARLGEDAEDAATRLSGQTPDEWDEWCRLEELKEEKRARARAMAVAKAKKKKSKIIPATSHISAQSHSAKSINKAPLKKKQKKTASPSINKKPKQTTAAIPKEKKPTRRKPSVSKRAKKQRR